MKKQLSGFVLGFLCAVLIFGLSVSAHALITARTAIEVEPINVMVNGEVFQPKNAQGEPVDVFVYNGTTYAPLRALAEAYGLVVGYDEEKNLATVDKPEAVSEPEGDDSAVPSYDDWGEEEEAKYRSFLALWDISGPRYITDAPGCMPYNAYQFYAKNETLTEDDVMSCFPNAAEYFRRFLIDAHGTSESALICCIAGDRTWYTWDRT